MKLRALGLAVIALLVIITIAAAFDTPVILRQVFSGGGGATESGQFAIHASIGQSVAGPTTNGTYRIESGFWNGSVPRYKVYLPITLR